MRKITRFAIILLLTGCSGFLEEKSQSEVRPSTISDMERLLIGDVYFTKGEGALFNNATDIFTDDQQCAETNQSSAEAAKDTKRWLFAWDPKMFDDGGGGMNLTFWATPYERIKGCNVILDYLDEMKGDAKKREYLRGEALSMRGFYYLMLVNFFGLPYNMGDPNKNPGVPLKLMSGVSDKMLPRHTVAQVYEQIEEDFLTGVKLMEEYDIKHTDISRINPLVVHGWLSRMYLYQEKWDKALEEANVVIEQSPDLHNLSSDTLTSVYDKNHKLNLLSVEALWSADGDPGGSESMKLAFIVSDDLMNQFGLDMEQDSLDIRADYQNKRNNSYVKKGQIQQTGETWASFIKKGYLNGTTGGLRVAELYLNRAEAYCRKYIETGNAQQGQAALNDLNYLRENRFLGPRVDKVLSDFKNPKELLDFCLRERRRELCGEGNHRWFDIRRLGLGVEHYFFFNEGGGATTSILEPNDRRYALPIPKKILENNTALVQNN